MPSENVTTKFKVDISDLKKNITEANKQVKLYRAELANASAGMAKGEETAESLTKKIEAQNKIVEAEKQKLEALKQELQRYERQLESGEKEIADLTKKHQQAAEAFGEDSKEAKDLAKQLADAEKAQERNANAADNLRVRIVQQDTAVKNAEGQVNRFSESLDDLQHEEDQTGDSAEKATSGGLQSFAVALGNLAANVITAAIKKLGELGKAALDAAADFDEGRDALIRATGAVDSGADELTKAYADAAKSVVGDMSDIGEAVGEVNTRFGYQGERLSKVSSEFLRFADITGTDATSAVQKVAKVLTASGEPLENYADLLDKVATASQSSGIGADELLSSLEANGATLRAMNYSIDDTIAMLAKFEEQGANSSTIIAGLKKATVAWQKEGKDANTELAASIHLIRTATDEETAAQIATEKFGKSGTEMADAIRRGAFEFEDYADIIENSGGAVENTYEEMQSGMDKVKLAMQGLKVTAGQAMSGLVDQFGGGVENIINLLSDALGGDSGALTAFSAAVGNFIGEAIEAAVEAIPDASDALLALAESLADAIPGVIENVVEAAAKMLPKITSALLKLLNKIAGFLGKNLDPLLASVSELVDAIISTLLDPAFLSGLVEVAGKLVASLVEGLTGDGMTKLLKAANKLGTALVHLLVSPEFLSSIAGASTQIIAALVKLLAVITPQLLDLVLQLIDSIGQELVNADWAAIGIGIVDAVIAGANSVNLDEFWDTWFSGLDDIKAGLQSVGDFCTSVWEDYIVKPFSKAGEFFKNEFEKAYDNVKKTFQNLLQNSIDLSLVLDAWLVAFDGIKNAFVKFGEFVADIFNKYIVKPFDFAVAALKASTSAFVNFCKKWFEDLGEDISAIVSTAKAFVFNAADSIKSKIETGVETAKAIFQNLGEFALLVWNAYIVAPFSKAGTFFKDEFTKAYNAVKSVFSGLATFFANIWNNIKNSFTSIGTKIGDAIGGAFKKAINAVLATVERNLNVVPDAINGMLSTINQLPGVNISGIGRVSLPRLAKGAIVDRATIAEVGEAGREAIIPLERNKQGLREIASLLQKEMGGGMYTGIPVQTGKTVNMTQNITSPTALSRYDIYRQTKNMLLAVQLQEDF